MLADTAIQFESILRDFYGVVAQQHPELDQKTKELSDFLEKAKNQSKFHEKIAQSQLDDNFETLTSIGGFDSPRQALQPAPVFGSSMLFTFLFDANSGLNHAPSPDKVITPHNFTSPSIEKLTLYALLVNHMHIQQSDARQQQHLSQVNTPYVQSYLLLKVIKRAMVAAAKEKRNFLGQKRYAKVRYLFDELMKRVEGESRNQEKHIKLIVEEFESCYITQVFLELGKDSNTLERYSYNSTVCLSPRIKEDRMEAAESSFSLEHYGAVLEKMSIKLTIHECREFREMGRADGSMSIVATKLRDGSFKLKEIITFSEDSQ